MSERLTEEELRAKADEPKRFAMKWHPHYRGKVCVELKAPVTSYDDFGVWYTPGVAEPCKDIYENVEKQWEHTNRSNFAAVVSDGSRVLGLGDIGPRAGMPVMEGKAMLFKYLGGVDAFPLCLDTKDPEELIKAVKWISPNFGAVNLEDIEKPKCFYVLDRLRKELDVPVWHDDQQGTALVTLAGLRSALKVVGKKMAEVSVAFIGAGAASMNNAKYTFLAGVKPENCFMCDSKGILHEGRTDIRGDPMKWDMAQKTNAEERTGGTKEALEGVDVLVSTSKSGPGVIKKEWVANMADDAIVFACANPIPEIWPWEAEDAGARIVGTGRSDFKNQVNNSLGFPAVFRGALDVAATGITDEMCLAASEAVSSYVEEQGLSEDYVIPTMAETEMYVREAVATGLGAMKQGVARIKLSENELEESARKKIKGAQRVHEYLRKEKIIPSLPS